ncbi:MAG: hypothetical protein CFH34_00071 [Alphaproteobacteria bacterium MarineAlpha9_Bin4]|nr:hypothetical protein [Pelagibacterales bacterium]PPR27591.1 MAG: hypothetical protein CFH34_00071 [Alphaproteobacteria bacterium MarineAlpha9_Bin4]
MRTNYNILTNVIHLLKNIEKVPSYNFLQKSKDRKALYNYIKNEYFNLKEYKELISSIKLKEEDVFEIIYILFKLFTDYKNTDKNKLLASKDLIVAASNIGFTWPDNKSCLNKIEEEFIELKNAIDKKNHTNIQEEIGDLIFTLHCYSNMNNYNFIEILDNANYKFKKRFQKLKELAKKEGLDINSLSLKDKEKLWNRAKKEDKLPK